MTKGFGVRIVPDQKNRGNKLIASPQLQQVSEQFFSHFRHLKDPRVERTRDHKLIDIIAVAILAVISGASGWQGMEDYGHSKQEQSFGHCASTVVVLARSVGARTRFQLSIMAFSIAFK